MNKVWNSIWSSYQDMSSEQIMNEPAGKTQREEFAELLQKHFDLKGKTILEVGTGTGQYCMELGKRGAICYGIDLEQESINLARRITKDTGAENCLFEKYNLFDINDNIHYDIVFSMGTVEHFTDAEIIKMLKKMGEIADHVVVGVPYSGSHAYMLSKQMSIAMGTWEYGVENDFHTMYPYFMAADIITVREKTIGIVSEAMYLKRINPALIPHQIAINEQKKKDGKQYGSWLVSIGRKE